MFSNSWTSPLRALVLSQGLSRRRRSLRKQSALRARFSVEGLEARFVPSATVSVELQSTIGSTQYVSVAVADSDQTDMTISDSKGVLVLTLNNNADDSFPKTITGISNSDITNDTLKLANLTYKGKAAVLANLSVNMESGSGPGGSITVEPGTTISTAGSISLTGTGTETNPVGVTTNGATLNANGENITLTGTGWNPGVVGAASLLNAYGVEIEGGAGKSSRR